MKNKKILWIVLIFSAFYIMGCFSTPSAKKPDPIPVKHSFAESGERTALVRFIEGKKIGCFLVDCEEVTRPSPAEGTYWERDSLFPVGRPLDLRVYVYWDENRYGDRRRGIFKCPPLEAGREYKLWYKGNKRGGSLILTDFSVKGLKYSSAGKPLFDIVYQQKVPPPK
jgi:hypothetical protein